MDYSDDKVFAALAAGQEIASEFKVHNVANKTWAFAVMNCCDEKLFSGASEFNVQGYANMARACA